MRKFVGSALGYGRAPCKVQVEFNSLESSTSGGTRASTLAEEDAVVPIYTNKDTVAGEVRVIPMSLKKVEHLGIRVQLVGEVVFTSDKHHPNEFLSVVQDLMPSGDITAIKAFPFEFKEVEMPYETYTGNQVSLRYSVRVIIARSMGHALIQDHFFHVRNPIGGLQTPVEHLTHGVIETATDGLDARARVDDHIGLDTNPDAGAASGNTNEDTIKMEVGIEDCLHIEFEYRKNAYHLQDVVIGRIHFLLVRIKLKHMGLEIQRRETVGCGINARLESTTVAKYEIMDGTPAKGESIPIRMYLSPYPLTPSYECTDNKFSVKYSLNLVLVDEEDRRYFKQHEITLYRLADEACRSLTWNLIGVFRAGRLRGGDPDKVHVVDRDFDGVASVKESVECVEAIDEEQGGEQPRASVGLDDNET